MSPPCFALLFTALLPGWVSAASEISPATLSSTPLFAAPLLSSDGLTTNLQSFRGQPLLINFWARWCQPCRAEIPELRRLQQNYRLQGLRVVGIGIESDVVAVRRFMAANQMDYPVFLSGGAATHLLGELGNKPQGLPYTLAINRQGKIVAARLGGLKHSDLEVLAAAALAK